MYTRLTLLGLCAAISIAAPALAFGPATGRSAAAAGTIVQAAAGSPDHKTLVAAVKAAGLVDTLAAKGPFTVFAPTDAAFARLPAGTVESLLQPANRDKLRSVLTYHVVPGRVTAAELTQMIEEGGGSARLKTVQGGTLTARHRRQCRAHRRCGRTCQGDRRRPRAGQRFDPCDRRGVDTGLSSMAACRFRRRPNSSP